MYKNHLKMVIKYLEGEVDIYNGKYNDVINTWNLAWDEMKFLGYNPENPNSIKNYIKREL